MPMSSRHAGLALSVRGIGKSYNVSSSQATTLTESVSGWVARARTRGQAEKFWALRDISFDVPQGQILGLVGRNGAAVGRPDRRGGRAAV